MTERPILFSGPMVRAILEGRKTQTRRVVRIDEPPARRSPFLGGDGRWYWHTGRVVHNEDVRRCPYGVLDDRLWVREAWAVDAPLAQVRREVEDLMGPSGFGHGPYFRADPVHENAGLTWRPPIHLPRWACRLVLEVVDVRVERLQDISDADAKAEGVLCNDFPAHGAECGPKGLYRNLWDSLNAKRGLGWTTNPWVWVVEFKRIAE